MGMTCGRCFQESLNEQGICTQCGFDQSANREAFPMALPSGSILYGRYIVGKVLGQGGFGITYMARDHQTGEIVAIKEFFPESMVTRVNQTMVTPFTGERGENFAYGKNTFLLEAKTMAEFIGNSNIVRVYSYFEENGTGYFVMEYVDGQNFQGYLNANFGRVPWEDALRILLPVMDALSIVHEKGIIHRDIAPDNICIAKDGTVKLLDFGAARYSLGNVSQSLDVVLRHGFAPKEQYKRHGRQGPYTDVYALGATLYYAITGNRPDDAIERLDKDTLPLPSTLGAKITEVQENVILKAMAIQPEDRYQTVAEFKAALTGTGAGKVPTGKPGLSKWLIPAGTAAAVLLVILLAVSGKEEPPAATERPKAEISIQEETKSAENRPASEAVPVQTFDHLGGTYEGQTQNGIPHGHGTLTWDGCTYTGNFEDGYPAGEGTATIWVNGGDTTLTSDSWTYIMESVDVEIPCDWMNTTKRETIGTYTGLACNGGVRCGWGVLEFSVGSTYTGVFQQGFPGGLGIYRAADSGLTRGDWDWTEQKRELFEASYPQSVTYYTGMSGGGASYGYGILAFEEAGVFVGEFQEGEVYGSGKYYYRQYNKTSVREGSDWTVIKDKKLDSKIGEGFGLALDGTMEGYGMSRSIQYGEYYIGEVESGKRSGYGRYFSKKGEEIMKRRGLYKGGIYVG